MKRFSYAALPLVMGMFSPVAVALGLGDVRALTPLGSPLQAEVALMMRPGEVVDDACFRLVRPRDDDGSPWLRRATLTVVRGATAVKLVLTTRETIREPILPLAVYVGCGVEMTREYTLLLSPPGIPAELPALATPAAPATTPLVLAARRTTPSAPGAGSWVPPAGQTLDAIARSMYPHSRRMQRAFTKAVLEANPVLDGGADAPLPDGVPLVLPDMRAVAPPPAPVRPRAEHADPAPASAARPRATATVAPLQMADRLVLGGEGDAEVDAVLRLKLSTELRRLDGDAAVSDQRRNLLRMEYRVVAQLSEQANSQLEVVNRMRELEATMAELRQLAQQLSTPTQTPTPAAPDSPPLAAAVPADTARVAPDEPVPVRTRASAPLPESASSWLEWLFFGGLAAAIAGVVGYAAYRGRRRPQEDYGWYGGHHIANEDGSVASSVFRAAAPAAVPLPAIDEPFVDTAALDDEPPPRPLPTRSESARIEYANEEEEGVTEVFEEHSVVELADIMLAFGRTKGAAEMLHEHIVANPKEALSPWFKLMEIYRQSGMREEFESVAMRLHKTFNVKVEDWDSAAREPGRGETLDAYPHIAAKLAELWRQPGCADYLRKLLEDNREGQRVGFPRLVAEEINLLLEVLGLDAGGESP